MKTPYVGETVHLMGLGMQKQAAIIIRVIDDQTVDLKLFSIRGEESLKTAAKRQQDSLNPQEGYWDNIF